jgi:alginate O-acetyltransferase complex protein AlgI
MLFTSYLLYASWGLRFLALLVFSSLLNYALGLYLRRRQSATRLWAGVILNIALLSTFKYLPGILSLLPNASLKAAFADIVLPVGISFWTFQALSYLFDVYQGKDLEPSLLEFLLYMAFWPTVLSGPICRLPNLLPQFRESPKLSIEDVSCGLDRICIGLVMTVLGQVLANGLHPGQGLDDAFHRLLPGGTGPDVWCLAIGYGFELFFNFAGYSHIVIGAARLFSIRLDENFARPYLATTPSEFWTRWHMSLSFWVRDYLFLPLAMVRRQMWWRSTALVLAMIVLGLWHKGSVLFAVWGFYHGVLIVLHRKWQQSQRRFGWRLPGFIMGPLSWLITFGAISLGWILFRAGTASQALTMLRVVVTPSQYVSPVLPPSLYFAVFACVLGYFGTVGVTSLWRYNRLFKLAPELRVALYAVAVYIGILHAAQTQSFIYFQF